MLSSAELSRVLEERQILSIVSHPFIVALAGSFQTPNSFYFIMTYAGGGDLTRWMQRQIGEPTARYVTAEVRRKCHQHGVRCYCSMLVRGCAVHAIMSIISIMA